MRGKVNSHAGACPRSGRSVLAPSQFASCSENYAIRPEVSGWTLNKCGSIVWIEPRLLGRSRCGFARWHNPEHEGRNLFPGFERTGNLVADRVQTLEISR